MGFEQKKEGIEKVKLIFDRINYREFLYSINLSISFTNDNRNKNQHKKHFDGE